MLSNRDLLKACEILSRQSSFKKISSEQPLIKEGVSLKGVGSAVKKIFSKKPALKSLKLSPVSAEKVPVPQFQKTLHPITAEDALKNEPIELLKATYPERSGKGIIQGVHIPAEAKPESGIGKAISSGESPRHGVRYVLYDPLHPFDMHTVTKEEIAVLHKANPEYLKEHLHVYIPHETTLSAEEFGKMTTRGGLLNPREFVVGEHSFAKPMVIFEGEGINPTVAAEITSSNLPKYIEAAKKGGYNVRIMEGGENPVPAVGTMRGLFATGFRPFQTIAYRARAGGVPGVLYGGWKLSPSERLYLSKVRSGDLRNLSVGEHASALVGLGLGRALPIYLAGSGVVNALNPNLSPEERMRGLRMAAFQGVSPSLLYTAPLWAWDPAMRLFGVMSPAEESAEQFATDQFGQFTG